MIVLSLSSVLNILACSLILGFVLFIFYAFLMNVVSNIRKSVHHTGAECTAIDIHVCTVKPGERRHQNLKCLVSHHHKLAIPQYKCYRIFRCLNSKRVSYRKPCANCKRVYSSEILGNGQLNCKTLLTIGGVPCYKPFCSWDNDLYFPCVGQV